MQPKMALNSRPYICQTAVIAGVLYRAVVCVVTQYQTQGSMHARQALCHGAPASALNYNVVLLWESFLFSLNHLFAHHMGEF